MQNLTVAVNDALGGTMDYGIGLIFMREMYAWMVKEASSERIKLIVVPQIDRPGVQHKARTSAIGCIVAGMKRHEALATILSEWRNLPLSERETEQQCAEFASKRANDPAYWFKCRRGRYQYVLGRLTLHSPGLKKPTVHT